MGAPSAMSNRTWKQRFAGRKAKSSIEDQAAENGQDETSTTLQEKKDLTKSNSGSNSVSFRGPNTTVDKQGSLSSLRKSSRFVKKNMRKRLSHLMAPKPGDDQQSAESSPSNPQTPASLDATEAADNTTDTDPTKKSETRLMGTTVTAATESKNVLYEWQDTMEKKQMHEELLKKQLIKERDGFCRRVGAYDGQIITVDGKPSYELGNYLGGGVAGVVYEGNRLLPSDEYPVRIGAIVEDSGPPQFIESRRHSAFSCLDPLAITDEPKRIPSFATNASVRTDLTTDRSIMTDRMAMDVAVEATTDTDNKNDSVLVDRPDAPSRSKYAAKAAASGSRWFMEETVAVKVLNPVGFRLLPKEATTSGVIVKEGETWSGGGPLPMQEKHVWWIVNPSSRNLATLQRYNQKQKDGTLKKSRDVDRGTPEKGLRLSLVAAYMNSNGELRELPLTRCIEIWGHIPFGASDAQFEEMMEAIERINAGHAPMSHPPSRVGTDASVSTGVSNLTDPVLMTNARTGLYRAAATSRETVFCESLNAYIAVPAVPPKYLRWLRQRRSATKEIRNMMLIGRHRNVVHLYEVLEHIEESKSTMFLILELVRGGELFDLISNNGSTSKKGVDVESEMQMRKYFRELSSGIYYCHVNGIAHRDLKPENLLVHNGADGESTLKIADFGLSATFNANHDDETIRDSIASPMTSPMASPQRPIRSASDSTGVTGNPSTQDTQGESMDRDNSLSFSTLSQQALQYITCGAMEDMSWCGPGIDGAEVEQAPSPLRRMTSVVGSPHYVAPEIISQTDDREKKKKNSFGYDGTKVDVWSAGVILYAMLYRSLPFGEDLLRCPRYQSYKKWYDEAREIGGRRSSAFGALNPVITAADEAELLGPHWFFPSRTSKESRDLIVAMLNPDPIERLSIQLVMQHPWFNMDQKEMSK